MKYVYKAQARSSLWLLKHIAKIDIEVRGQENIIKGPILVASKHQSAWETFALAPSLTYPVVILKHELMYLPLLGWYAIKFGHIPVKRGKGRKTVEKLLKDAKNRLTGDKQLLIFPEGTRKASRAAPDYKTGIFRLYESLDIAVVPVALNSGLYWPRRTFKRYPGTVIAQFLPPIMPGLSRKEFMETLESHIEEASENLILEAQNSKNPPPIPKKTTQL